jgi:hypothetical protein
VLAQAKESLRQSLGNVLFSSSSANSRSCCFLLWPLSGHYQGWAQPASCECLQTGQQLTLVKEEAMNEKPFFTLIQCRTSVKQALTCYVLKTQVVKYLLRM